MEQNNTSTDHLDALVEEVSDVDAAHRVIAALSSKFDLVITVESTTAPGGLEVTVPMLEDALQTAVDNHPDAQFRDTVHQIWAGVLDGLLDAPVVVEHEGTLYAPNYTSADDLARDYLTLLTTGPWRPLLGLTPVHGGGTVGYLSQPFDTMLDAYHATDGLVGRNVDEVVPEDDFALIFEAGTEAVVESYNLFRMDGDTENTVFRIIP